jgi:hypothetical protein
LSIRDRTGPPKPPGKTSVFFLVFISILLASCGITPPPPLTVPSANSTATPLIVPRKDGGDIVVNVQKAGGEILTEGVVVRVSSTNQVDDFDEGELRIGPCDPGQVIVAWAPGYKTGKTNCDGQTRFYSITLDLLVPKDNPFYAWKPAVSGGDPSSYCAGCHTRQRSTSLNEFEEWQKSGHASIFSDRFFETIYLGTNLNNNKSLDTDWSIIDNHLVQKQPNENGYFGPGYKLDYPYQYGNCAYCHAPAAVGPAMTEADLGPHFSSNGGTVREGITCDICHKVIGLQLNDNGDPYADRPGILTFQFLRPFDSSDFFIGPLINYTTPNSPYHTSTCSSVLSESAFCAACHYGKFYDSVIYGSYKEWRNSEYGRNPASPTYRTCQDCHMAALNRAVTGDPRERQICSIFNIENRDYNHNMMDFGYDVDSDREIPRLIKNAAKVDATFEYNPAKKNWLNVTAIVTPQGVGHRFPTDSPLRHLILVVEAWDANGSLLDQVDGEVIPSWAGTGNAPSDRSLVQPYGGKPGTIFANLLMEEDTNISPTTAYWNETRLAWVGDLQANSRDHSDTRLYPDEPSISNYSFEVPDRGDITVTIKLIYRFAFYDLMLQKGWYRPDVQVALEDWTCKRSQDRTTFTCN